MEVPVRLPRANANDDEVTLVEWSKDEGALVERGECLCVVETSKASFEVQAEANGYLKRLAKPGDRVAVQQVIAYLTNARADAVPSNVETVAAPVAPAPAATGSFTLTAKAEALVLSFGIDPAKLGKSGLIRERDIQAFAAGGPSSVQGEPGWSTRVTPTPSPGDPTGVLNPEFLAHIRAAPQHFARLPSDFKIWLYRLNGAIIGDGVALAPGVILDAQRVVIGANCTLGENVLVRCRQFRLGRCCEIGADSKVMCLDFTADDDVLIRFRVAIVEGGGMHSCRIGPDSFIAYDTYINADRDVVIGRHVCLSPGVRIFTHRKWLSPLEGFSSAFAPVTIGDDCHLGPNVVVLPGVDIGPRVSVMPNSTVASNVAPERLIGGTPAIQLVDPEAYRRRLTRSDKDRIFRRMLRESAESLVNHGLGLDGYHDDETGIAFSIRCGASTAAVVYSPLSAAPGAAVSRWILFGFDSAVLDHASDDVTAFDLTNYIVRGARDTASDALREQLHFLGLDFAPKFRPISAQKSTARYDTVDGTP